MSKNHEKFKSFLIESDHYARLVVDYYESKGFEVQYRPPHIPDTIKDRVSDTGDLQISRDGKDWKIIEVKSHPRITSEVLERYPYILIDKKKVYDAKEPKPDWYFIVCKDEQYATIFDCKNFGQCTTMEYVDQVTGKLEKCYHARNHLLKRIKIG